MGLIQLINMKKILIIKHKHNFNLNYRSKDWLYFHERNHKKFTNKENIKNFRSYKIWLSAGNPVGKR